LAPAPAWRAKPQAISEETSGELDFVGENGCCFWILRKPAPLKECGGLFLRHARLMQPILETVAVRYATV